MFIQILVNLLWASAIPVLSAPAPAPAPAPAAVASETRSFEIPASPKPFNVFAQILEEKDAIRSLGHLEVDLKNNVIINGTLDLYPQVFSLTSDDQDSQFLPNLQASIDKDSKLSYSQIGIQRDDVLGVNKLVVIQYQDHNDLRWSIDGENTIKLIPHNSEDQNSALQLFQCTGGIIAVAKPSADTPDSCSSLQLQLIIKYLNLL